MTFPPKDAYESDEYKRDTQRLIWGTLVLVLLGMALRFC